MAKDYAKLKALAQQMIECIGDEPEGENPSLPKQDNAENDGGQEPNTKFLESTGDSKAEEKVEGYDDEDGKKKKKDSALAMMGSMLASKLGK